MAIDTQRKRQSIVAISAYFLGPAIVPDSSFAQGDRQTIGYGYYGINVQAPGGITFPVFSEEGMHSNVFGGLITR